MINGGGVFKTALEDKKAFIESVVGVIDYELKK
jgi:hypothetical protein